MKFGGKSLDTPQKVQNICKNIKKIYKKDKELIIIVSAMGKTTDELLKKSTEYYQKNCNRRELDALLSTGETQSSALFAIALNNIGVPAKSLQAFQLGISTFGDYQNSLISHINKSPIIKCFEKKCIAVVAGFQGINSNEDITTLGRGGSDTTAAALGAIFNHEVEIYSDFDGIFAGDPRKINNLRKINKISFDSIKNMAISGAKVLDARAADIASKHNTKLICKQSSDFNKKGTIVSNIEDSFISLSLIDNLCKITLTFSQDRDIKIITKNVINILNSYKIYNLAINFNQIEFYIKQIDKPAIESKLAKKLKLLKS